MVYGKNCCDTCNHSNCHPFHREILVIYMEQKYKGQISALLRQHSTSQITKDVANYIDTLEEGIDIYDKMVVNYRKAMTILLCTNVAQFLVALMLYLSHIL